MAITCDNTHKRIQPGVFAFSAIYLFVVILICGRWVYLSDLRFSDATVELIGAPGDDAPISVETLFALRAATAVFCIAILWIIINDEPLLLPVACFKGSGLPVRPDRPLRFNLSGLHRLYTFTLQSWVLVTIYFVLASCGSALVASGLKEEVSAAIGEGLVQCLCFATWLLFETGFTCSLLVTVVVTFVLIPHSIKSGLDFQKGLRPTALILHNCNVLFFFTDMLLGQRAMVVNHLPAAVIFGCWYGVFSLFTLATTGATFYPFLDPTLPPFKQLAMLTTLLLVMVCFFLLGMTSEVVKGSVGFWIRALVMYAIMVSITYTPLTRTFPVSPGLGKDVNAKVAIPSTRDIDDTADTKHIKTH